MIRFYGLKEYIANILYVFTNPYGWRTGRREIDAANKASKALRAERRKGKW